MYAKGSKWQNLKPLYKYSASAFHLKNDVSVMEIRRYDTYDNYKKYNKPTIEMKYYKTPLNLLEAKLVKRFKNSIPILLKSSAISIDFQSVQQRSAMLLLLIVVGRY